LSQRINKFLFLLTSEYYLFWTIGITAGLYTAGKFNLCNINIIITWLVAIILLLTAEFVIVKKTFHSNEASDSLKDIILNENRQFLMGGKSLSGSRINRNRILVTIVIPFLILFFAGNLSVSTRELKEARSIFVNIYKIGSCADYGSDNYIFIEGRVSDHPVKSYQNLNFSLYADKINFPDNADVSTGFLNVGEFINVRLKNAGSGSVIRDDYLRLKGYLKRVDLKYLSGGDNSYNEIILMADWEDSGKIVCSSPLYKIFIFRRRLYNCLKNAFYRYLDYRNASIAESLILGNRNNISEYVAESFKKCGLYHLFAISGLHLSFFVSLIYLVFRRFKNSIIVFWTVIVFLVIYNFLVVGRASILRASVAAFFMILARSWGREYSRRVILYLSYIILIIYNPYFLYDIGFWMTYISMSALVFVYPLILRIAATIPVLKTCKKNFFIEIVLITISIKVVLFPVLAYFFEDFSLISPVTNFFLLPFFYVLLFILMLSSFTIVIWPPMGGFILKSSSFVFEFVLKSVNIFGKLDFFVISFDNFTVRNALAYYIVLIVVLIFIFIILGRVEIRK